MKLEVQLKLLQLEPNLQQCLRGVVGRIYDREATAKQVPRRSHVDEIEFDRIPCRQSSFLSSGPSTSTAPSALAIPSGMLPAAPPADYRSYQESSMNDAAIIGKPPPFQRAKRGEDIPLCHCPESPISKAKRRRLKREASADLTDHLSVSDPQKVINGYIIHINKYVHSSYVLSDKRLSSVLSLMSHYYENLKKSKEEFACLKLANLIYYSANDYLEHF